LITLKIDVLFQQTLVVLLPSRPGPGPGPTTYGHPVPGVVPRGP